MSVTPCQQLSKMKSLVSLITKHTTLYIEACEKAPTKGNKGEHQDDLNRAIQNHAREITDGCSELARLVQKPGQVAHSPEDKVLETALAYTKSAALALALDMDLFGHVQTGETATSLEEIAQLTGASKKLIKNVMKICADSSIFKEVTPGTFVHTQMSRLLIQKDSYLRTYSSYVVDDGLIAGAFLPRVLREHNFQPPPDRTKSAFCKAFDASDPYDYYHSTDLARGTRFNRAMEGNHTTHKDYHPMDMVIPFEKLPFGAVVVDVGGGRGHNALRLATKFQHITVIVQDHESVIFPAEDEIKVPSSVEGRIQFHPHDYYDPQPIKDADVYILSNILMDNPESDCKRILSRLAAAMTPNKSKLVICDKLDRESGPVHHNMAQLHILSCFNSWSRNMDEWRTLIADSSKGLAVERFWEIGTGVVFEVGLARVA